MFTDAACDWLENLPDDKKDTFQHLEDAFKERFVQPAILRFRFSLVKNKLRTRVSIFMLIGFAPFLKRSKSMITRFCMPY